ncbi:BMC domain-containing protein [Actinomycetospora sp. C-140]
MAERGAGAIGILETRGVVALSAGIEAMMKTADVETVAVERVSSGYLAAAVRGPLAAVRQAINAGSAAIEQYGELRAAQVYPKPHGVSVGLLENGSSERLARAIEASGSGSGQ